MNLTETATVLAKAAAYDRRTVGEGDILAWHEALEDVDCGDALEAVRRHYRESTDWLMPAHVRRLVRQVREERRRTEAHEVRALPSRFEDDAVRDRRVADGVTRCRDVLSVILADLQAHRASPEPPTTHDPKEAPDATSAA